MNKSKYFFSVLIFVFLSVTENFSKVTPYDEMFRYLNVSSSNVMIESVGSADPDLVYTALRKIGQLRLTNAHKAVIAALSKANPSANQGKVHQSTQQSDVFNMGVWTLSQIGNEQDVSLLASFIKDIPNQQNQLSVFAALGEFSQSTNALKVLHYYSQIVSDEQVARQIVKSIRRHGSLSSLIYLVKMGKRSNFSDKFKAYIAQTITFLATPKPSKKK